MENSVALEVKNLQVLYGDKHVVHDVSMKFHEKLGFLRGNDIISWYL